MVISGISRGSLINILSYVMWQLLFPNVFCTLKVAGYFWSRCFLGIRGFEGYFSPEFISCDRQFQGDCSANFAVSGIKRPNFQFDKNFSISHLERFHKRSWNVVLLCTSYCCCPGKDCTLCSDNQFLFHVHCKYSLRQSCSSILPNIGSQRYCNL